MDILKLINSDFKTFAWALGLFVAASFIYAAWVLPKFWNLNKAIKLVLNKISDKSILNQKDIYELSSCGHPALADALQETANRIINIGSDKRASYLSSPDDLWHFRYIFAKNFNYSLAEAAPNILVGLGLLMTFFFLTSALSEATVALMGNQNEQKDLLQATRGLLGAAGAKFLTSIAGLGSSILWTIAFKTQSSKTTHGLSDIYRKITKNISIHGTEHLNVLQTELLAKNITAQHEYQEVKKLEFIKQKLQYEELIIAVQLLGEKLVSKNQESINAMSLNIKNTIETENQYEIDEKKKLLHELIERFENRNIGFHDESIAIQKIESINQAARHDNLMSVLYTIGEFIPEENSKNIIPAIELAGLNIQTSLDQLGGKIGTMNQDALNTMLSNFANLIKTATRDEIEQMKKSLLELSVRLEDAAKIIETGALGAGTALKESGDHLSLKITETGHLINATLRQGADNLRVEAVAVAQIFDTVSTNLLANAKSASNEFNSSTQRFSENISNTGEKFELSMTTTVEKVNDQFGIAGKLFKDNVLDAGHAFTETVKVGSEQFSASSVTVARALDTVSTNLISNAKSASRELDIGAQASALHFSQAGAKFENYAVLAGDAFSERVKTSTNLIAEGSTAISKSMIEGSFSLLENSKLASSQFNSGTQMFSENILSVGSKFKESMTETVEKFNEKLQSGLAIQSESIYEMANTIHAINSAMTSLHALVQHAEKTGQSGFIKVQETMMNLDSLVGKFDTSMHRWQSSFDKVSQVSDALHGAANNLVNISSEQNKSITTFTNAIPSISVIIQQMNETIHITSRGNTEQIMQTETAIKSTRDSLGKTVLTIQEGVRQYSEQIALLHRNLDEKIAEAINKIASGVDRLAGAIDDLDDSLEKVATR